MATTTTTATVTAPAASANFVPTPAAPHPRSAVPPAPRPPSTLGPVKSEAPPAPSSTTSAATTAAAASGAEDPSYIITVPSYSAWFSFDSIHDTERRLLPEFFEGEAAAASGCRGPDAYKYYRNTLIRRFRARPGRRLTLTEARRGLVGDVGSVRRVFDFLEEWGLINHGALPSGSKQAKEKREEAAPQSSSPSGATAPRKLCTGCRTVCGLAYFACEKRVEITEDAKSDWTDKETLHLLEAVLHYGEDWKKVSEHVGSRSEKDCIARFIRLPFGEQFMGPKEDRMGFENDDDITDEPGADISKRLRLTPLADASNPIMAQVAFLSAIVGSDAASAAAQAAIAAQSRVDLNDGEIDPSTNSGREEESSHTNGLSVNDLLKEAAANARAQLDKERNSIEQSLSDIVDVQMKEIQDKICRFEQKEMLMESERQQLCCQRDLLFTDQLAIMQHQRKPQAVAAESKYEEAPKSVINIS
ncbi:SWI/SNF complex subunit SWI3B [Dichanthelium oligosanthes]|uniref:SWI/SNF complex subunit SWI3B n=1 Tax=Dichanthelium oligosanthes TaxID=888268 RepID=A0A1E5UXQ8_9POAL|nr:SWI/SNF complex subunit SWI3B [Dichanthelium oligosanthes]